LVVPKNRQNRYELSKSQKRAIRKRCRKRTDPLLEKLGNIGRSGTIVTHDADGTPMVLVRVDEILILVEWIRDMKEQVNSMKKSYRDVVDRHRRGRGAYSA
jgi:hypothetical protein